MIRPVAGLLIRNFPHVELSSFGEVQRSQLDDAVVFAAVGDVNALIDGKAVDFAILMVDMRPQGADPVGAEDPVIRLLTVDF